MKQTGIRTIVHGIFLSERDDGLWEDCKGQIYNLMANGMLFHRAEPEMWKWVKPLDRESNEPRGSL